MRFAKAVVIVVAVVAVGMCGFDCLAMTAPEQAMQCCNSMPCAPSSHHGQDCCKTMPSVQTAFLQSSLGHVVSPADFGTVNLAEFGGTPDVSTAAANAVGVGHPPPIPYSQASPPIRI